MTRILVVDDDDAIRKVARVMLEAAGFSVAEAADGQAGLAACAAFPPPDAVLLDIDMPGLDGLSVLRELRSRPATATLPVVMCTTYNALPLIAKALELGALEYIMKPFDAEILESKLSLAGIT
jgi:two-component system, chemotaxis family, chemotaxis protein CheY